MPGKIRAARKAAVQKMVARNPFTLRNISGVDAVSPQPKVQAFSGANLTRS